jgi:hypothetical protein
MLPSALLRAATREIAYAIAVIANNVGAPSSAFMGIAVKNSLLAFFVAWLMLGAVGHSNDKKPLAFRPIAMGEVRDESATEAGFRTRSFSYTHLGVSSFEASNGAKLTVQYGNFVSTEEAKRYFDWYAGKADRVLAKGPETNSQGSPAGYRAELALKASEPTSAVIWTDGANAYIIYATHLRDALELEKQYAK